MSERKHWLRATAKRIRRLENRQRRIRAFQAGFFYGSHDFTSGGHRTNLQEDLPPILAHLIWSWIRVPKGWPAS